MFDLLDRLAHINHCFISDLKQETCLKQIIHFLKGIEPNHYPDVAWKETFRYLTSKETEGKTCEDIKQDLLKELNQRLNVNRDQEVTNEN